MAFSSNPRRHASSRTAIGFAFRPVQGALDDVAGTVVAVGRRAIGEIDRLRSDNAALRARERAADRRERSGPQEIERENEQLTGAAPAPDRRSSTRPPPRRSSPASRRESRRVGHDLEGAPTTGSRSGDVVDRRRRRAGRPGHRGRPELRERRPLISDRSSTVIGQTETSAATRRGRRPARRRADHAEHRLDREGHGRRAGPDAPASSSAGGDPLAVSEGPPDRRQVDRRPKRDANAVVQTAYLLPTADLDKLDYVLVILDYEGGLPPVGRHADRLQPRTGGRCPAASSRASSRAHALPSADALCYRDARERHRPRRRDGDAACSRSRSSRTSTSCRSTTGR